MAAWTPARLASLRLWLKGDGLSGSDGSAVASWADSSGNANDATGATNKPTLKTGLLNGLNAVRFAGASSQYFTLPTGMLTGHTQGAAFFVAKVNNDPVVNGSYCGPPVGDFTSSTVPDAYPWTSGSIGSSFMISSRPEFNPGPSLANWHIGSFSAKPSEWRFDMDGSNIYSGGGVTVTPGTAPLIGGTQGGLYRLDGDIAEVIYCNAVPSTLDRQRIEGFLAHKWGLAANLPSGHPYKSAAPQIVPMYRGAAGKAAVYKGVKADAVLYRGANALWT